MVLATWRRHSTNTSRRIRGRELAASRVALIEQFFSQPDLPDQVRGMRRQALSSAYYVAAVLALHDDRVPGRRYAWQSLFHKFCWPDYFLTENKRSWKLMFYLLGLPLTKPLKGLYVRMLEIFDLKNRLRDLRP